MGWKVRVSYLGLRRDFGTGKQDTAYKSRKLAEERAKKLQRTYLKYPEAKVRVVYGKPGS